MAQVTSFRGTVGDQWSSAAWWRIRQDTGSGLSRQTIIGIACGPVSKPAHTEPCRSPKRAVWDEFSGMWITCLLLPKTLPWLAAGFVVFRVLDILKPWPIRKFERLPGGLGIMANDLAAGVAGAVELNVAYGVFF